MDFTKVEATGNDFILIDGHGEERNWPSLARTMCNRHFGIGADGLLILLPSEIADFRMQIFNADGTEAEMCGNGLRCIAKYAREHFLAEMNLSELTIETKAGIRNAYLQMRGVRVLSVRLGMGYPQLSARDIPILLPKEVKNLSADKSLISFKMDIAGKDLLLKFVSMGNPHAVCFLNEPIEQFPLAEIGPLIEKHDIFPERTNFEIVNILGKNKVKARVWERGVGETLSCGSGACAIGVASQLSGFADNRIDVVLPGGTLNIEWDGTNEVQLAGPAREVFHGDWLESE